MCCEDEDDCPCCSCCSQKCQDRSLLVLVAILIGFAYASWWIVVAIHWQWWNTTFGLINTIVFNFVVLMIVVSWGRTIFSDPGYNPPGWVSYWKITNNNYYIDGRRWRNYLDFLRFFFHNFRKTTDLRRSIQLSIPILRKILMYMFHRCLTPRNKKWKTRRNQLRKEFALTSIQYDGARTAKSSNHRALITAENVTGNYLSILF